MPESDSFNPASKSRKLKIPSLLIILLTASITGLLVLFFIPAYQAPPLPLEGLTDDGRYMAYAFAEIGKMNPQDGYPVGAVVVLDGKIIGRSSNRLFAENDPAQHAEYRAMDLAIAAVKRQNSKESYQNFFQQATLYVTLEPCPMCMGKAEMLRFERIVYCDTDEEWGNAGTVGQISGFPAEVKIEQSTLPLCQELRDRPGWNFHELFEIGKSYAASTKQMPSKLSLWFQKITEKLR